jgi:RNA polymerase sigma factor (TIGR02999 family)
MSQVTLILKRAQAGDPKAAEELLPLVYDELRKLAAAKIAREAPGQTLQATALVHEAWLRLGGDEQPNWQNRAHFFGAAAEAMRRILVDRARRRKRIRHGAGQAHVDLTEVPQQAPEEDARVLMVNEGLDALAEEQPIKAQVVKLRFFVGLTAREVSEVLGVTERTVERHWAYAKVWLLRYVQLSEGSGK